MVLFFYPKIFYCISRNFEFGCFTLSLHPDTFRDELYVTCLQSIVILLQPFEARHIQFSEFTPEMCQDVYNSI